MPVHPWEVLRALARRVDVDDAAEVGGGERVTEVAHERACARVEMGLEHGDEPTRIQRPRTPRCAAATFIGWWA